MYCSPYMSYHIAHISRVSCQKGPTPTLELCHIYSSLSENRDIFVTFIMCHMINEMISKLVISCMTSERGMTLWNLVMDIFVWNLVMDIFVWNLVMDIFVCQLTSLAVIKIRILYYWTFGPTIKQMLVDQRKSCWTSMYCSLWWCKAL